MGQTLVANSSPAQEKTKPGRGMYIIFSSPAPITDDIPTSCCPKLQAQLLQYLPSPVEILPKAPAEGGEEGERQDRLVDVKVGGQKRPEPASKLEYCINSSVFIREIF